MAKVNIRATATTVTLSPLARVLRTVLQVLAAFGAAMPTLIGGLGLTGVQAAKVTSVLSGIMLVASTVQNLLEHFNVIPTIGGKIPTTVAQALANHVPSLQIFIGGSTNSGYVENARAAGRRGVIKPTEAPKFWFRKHITSPLPTPTVPFDYARLVKGGFPMADNDRLGNCTIAGFWHLVQLLYAAVGEVLAYVGDEAIADAYWELVGHGPTYPGDPGPGLMLETVLQAAMRPQGLLGVRIVAYGAVDPSDIQLMIDAAYNFGGIYLAGDIPADAESQFEDNDGEWVVAAGNNPGIGGHCFVGSGSDIKTLFDNETWGAENSFSFPWWKKYGMQAYVVIPEIFVTKNHGPLANIDVAGLKAEFPQLAQ